MDTLEQPEHVETWGAQFDFAPEDKARFAAELLKRPKEPLQAAIATFGAGREQLGKCSYAGLHWQRDPEVIEHMQKLLSGKGVANFLPSKEEVARRVWEWTQEAGLDMDSRIKAAKLLCEIQDYIPKPGTAVNVSIVNRVMEVPVAKSDDAWESELQRQQEASKRDVLAVH